MTSSPRPVCKVCRRPLGAGEQYLVRVEGTRTTAVHRNLCFPPAKTADQRGPERRAA